MPQLSITHSLSLTTSENRASPSVAFIFSNPGNVHRWLDVNPEVVTPEREPPEEFDYGVNTCWCFGIVAATWLDGYEAFHPTSAAVVDLFSQC